MAKATDYNPWDTAAKKAIDNWLAAADRTGPQMPRGKRLLSDNEQHRLYGAWSETMGLQSKDESNELESLRRFVAPFRDHGAENVAHWILEMEKRRRRQQRSMRWGG
uniref:Uncharacterized protein n=1 Tax=viral metagenome TaxID=1070528 RepID=A0A6H1ZJ79_9ZZZZ